MKRNLKFVMLNLIREYHEKGTIGRLSDESGLLCYTLERPNLGNQRDNPNTKENDSSCIPEGIYTVKRDKIGRFRYFAIQEVPSRQNIEIHPANSIDDLLGCIGLGQSILLKRHGYDFWLDRSKIACQKVLEKYPNGFELKITSLK